MDTVADKLREARALVAKGWTQGSWARDADGRTVLEDSPAAVCFCARGAIWRASGGRSEAAEKLLNEAIFGPNPMFFFVGWQDEEGRTQAEVVAAFDRAIELAEAGQ